MKIIRGDVMPVGGGVNRRNPLGPRSDHFHQWRQPHTVAAIQNAAFGQRDFPSSRNVPPQNETSNRISSQLDLVMAGHV